MDTKDFQAQPDSTSPFCPCATRLNSCSCATAACPAKKRKVSSRTGLRRGGLTVREFSKVLSTLASACALSALLCGTHGVAQNAPSLVPRADERPSFDCSKAKTASARLICADGELARLDSQLGAAFQRQKNQIPASEQQQFVAEEVAWIRERNKRCNLVGNDAAAIEALVPSKPCMISAIQARINSLSEFASTQSPSAAGLNVTSLKRGTYIAKGTSCAQASNSVLMNFDGDRFFGGHGYCLLAQGASGPTFVLKKACPIEGGQSSPDGETYTIVSPNEFKLKNGVGEFDYQLCEQAELPEVWRGMVRVTAVPTRQPGVGGGDVLPWQQSLEVTPEYDVTVSVCPGCSGQPEKQTTFSIVNFRSKTNGMQGRIFCHGSGFNGEPAISINIADDDNSATVMMDESGLKSNLNFLRAAAWSECQKAFQPGVWRTPNNASVLTSLPQYFTVYAARGQFEGLKGFANGLNSEWVVTQNLVLANELQRQAQVRAQQQLSEQIAQARAKPVTLSVSGPLSSEVAECVRGFFPRMGFSAPMIKGSPCSDFIRVIEIKTSDSRDIPGGTEVLTDIIVEAVQPIGGSSMIAGACYGGTPNDIPIGGTIRIQSRIQFEKWNSGLRCTSTRW